LKYHNSAFANVAQPPLANRKKELLVEAASQEHPILSRVESAPVPGRLIYQEGLPPHRQRLGNGPSKNQEELMTGKRKSAGAVGRAGRSAADLGQKEAQLEKTQ